jgi:hypothetical protein
MPQSLAVEFIQPPSFAGVGEVFLSGVAERQEHRVRADAAG